MDRFKISLMLPKLLAKPDMVREVLTGTQYAPAISLVDSFVKRRDDIVKERKPPLSDHGLIKIIDYFQFNSEIYNLFPNIHDIISPEKNELLKIFEGLCDICELHLLRSAKKDINNEQRLNKLYHDNEKMMQNIEDFLARIAVESAHQKWKHTSRVAVFEECKKNLQLKKDENERKMFNNRSV